MIKSMNLIRKIVSYSSKAIVALGILFLGVSGYNYLVATKPEKSLQPRLEKIWTVEVASIDFQVAFPKKSSLAGGSKPEIVVEFQYYR